MGIDIRPSLLLPFREISKDIGPNRLTPTPSGGVTIDTVTAGPYGDTLGVLDLDGIDAFLTLLDNDFMTMDGDRTIEVSVYMDDLAPAVSFPIFEQGIETSNGDPSNTAQVNGSGTGSVTWNHDSPGSWSITTGTGVITASTWHHIAFVKRGSTVEIWVDGTLEATGAVTGTPNNLANDLKIGRGRIPAGSGWYYFAGKMADFRWTPRALYSAAFTPPSRAHSVPTDCTWDPYRDKRVFHLHGDALTDLSPSAHGITNNGVTVVADDLPYGTGILRFAGAENLEVANDPDWQFGSGDFCVEAYIKPNNVHNGVIASQYGTSGATNRSWLLTTVDDGTFQCISYDSPNSSTGNSIVSAVEYVPGRYHHVAMSRVGTTLSLYVDGRLEGSLTLASDPPIDTEPLLIGCRGESLPTKVLFFDGDIAELIITKGSGKYFGPFSVGNRRHSA